MTAEATEGQRTYIPHVVRERLGNGRDPDVTLESHPDRPGLCREVLALKVEGRPALDSALGARPAELR